MCTLKLMSSDSHVFEWLVVGALLFRYFCKVSGKVNHTLEYVGDITMDVRSVMCEKRIYAYKISFLSTSFKTKRQPVKKRSKNCLYEMWILADIGGKQG